MASEEENSEEEEITPVNTDLPPLPAFKIEPFNPETAKLSFEPYHTVDYFASQGIKFREEEKPKDKFSQQLKSFTEWLKTLKKVPETTGGSAPTATGPEDKKVTQLAAHSLTEGAVVTEAMADVWEKQGNHEKAIETYRKLSLLNPSKSAYFAAKIDHLKQL
jgi:tetratricopeptide (TPR) repeat protein